MNLLFKIIEKIENEKLCFKYSGACSTCGMMDVKRELKKYSFEDIIEAFESLDFNNEILMKKYSDGLKKLYSLITGQYTVYYNRYDFNIFENKLRNNFPYNYFANSLIASNDKRYWKNWKYRQKLEKEEQEKLKKQRQKEKEILKKIYQTDHELRNSQYRKNLIEKLKKLDTKERVEYIANDTKHGIKFYPSVLIIEAKNAFNEFDIDILKKLQRKLTGIKKYGPWSGFKRELNYYINEKKGY
jgi:hypothetical protein